MADAADALHYAHGQGIIHRDVKPSNLILATDARILVGDFGLAKTVGDESVTLTGSLIGTIRYLSPEQAMAKRVPVDHRTDIYSLGATMYELLCFQPAFPGNHDQQILAAIIAREPTPLRKVATSVPPELETICLKALEKLPDARYDTARALAEDLRRYMNDLPIVAKRPSVIRRVRKFTRRNRAAMIAAAAILALAVALPLLLRETRQESRQRRAAEVVTQAAVYEKGDHWSTAAVEYEKALSIDPDSVDALGNYARMKKEQYNEQFARQRTADWSLLEDAVRLCERALRVDPNRASLWNLNGVLHKKLEDYGKAIAAYEKALELEPENDAAWENLALVYALDGDLETASVNLKRAVGIAGTEGYQCESPWRNLAALELHFRNPAAAEHIQTALACSGKDPATWRLRARLLLELESHVDVAAALGDAVYADRLLDGKDPVVKRLLALARLHQGAFREAADSALAALELGGSKAINHFILAIAEARAGNHAAAKAHYEDALKHWPTELQEPDGFVVSATAGVLWLESAEQLQRLQDEAIKRSSDSTHP